MCLLHLSPRSFWATKICFGRLWSHSPVMKEEEVALKARSVMSNKAKTLASTWQNASREVSVLLHEDFIGDDLLVRPGAIERCLVRTIVSPVGRTKT